MLLRRWAVFLFEPVTVGQGAAVEQMVEGRVFWDGPLSRRGGRVELSPVVVELAEEVNNSCPHESLDPDTKFEEREESVNGDVDSEEEEE